MRQGKVSDLIHSSEDHPNLDYCKVEVCFQMVIDHPDGTFSIVPDSEFVVARKATRDDQSSYSINGKGSDYKKVAAFLRNVGIDLDHNRTRTARRCPPHTCQYPPPREPHARTRADPRMRAHAPCLVMAGFLILQGEVEAISMMSPMELLAYLEDIIGCNRLIPDIEAAAKAIEELNEERLGKLNALKAAQQQVAALEPRREAAEAYLATEAQYNSKRSAHCQKMAASATAEASEAEAQADDLAATLAEKQEAAAGSKAECEALAKEHAAAAKDRDACKVQLDKTQKEFQAFEREETKHRVEKKAAKEGLKKAQKAKLDEERRLSEARGELAAAQEAIPEYASKSAAIGAQKAEAQKELDAMFEALQGQTEPVRIKIEAATKAKGPRVEALDELKSAEALARGELELIDQKVADGAAERDKAQSDLTNHIASTQRSRDELDACEAEGGDLQARLAAQEKSLGDDATIKALIAEESSLRATYEERKAAAGATSSNSKLMEKLLKEKRDGRLPGIIGRLGSLCSIDAKYDVAGSTACGALDNIVVADTPTAQKCVDYLRANNLGVATFIILAKQAANTAQVAKMDAAYTPPKDSRRLFDLLTIPDASNRIALYSAFRDTLVCETDAKAKQVALGGTTRHRVVTVDGVVIETSGTLSGGGRPSSGRIGERASEGERLPEGVLTKMLADADAKRAEADRLVKARDTAKTAVHNLQSDQKKLRVLTEKLKKTLSAADAKQAALEARVAQGSDAGQLDAEEAKRKAALEKELGAIGKKRAKAQADVDAADAELAKLNQQVLEAGGTPLYAKKTFVEMKEQEQSTVDAKLTRAEAQAEASTKSIAKLEKALAKAEATAAEQNDKIETFDATFKKLENDALVVMEKVKETEAHLEKLNEELDEAEAAHDAAKAVVSGVRKGERDLEAQVEALRKTSKDKAKAVSHWQAKLEELREEVQAAVEEAAKDAQALAEAAAAAGEEGDADAFGAQAAAEAAAAGGEELGGGVLATLSAEDLAALEGADLKSEIEQLRKALDEMPAELSVLGEYKQRARELARRTAAYDDVTARRDAQRDLYEAKKEERKAEFEVGFAHIGTQLKIMYQVRIPRLPFNPIQSHSIPFHAPPCPCMPLPPPHLSPLLYTIIPMDQMITIGGDAELDLRDSIDPFAEGIKFSVRPPKKSWKIIKNLSGGEKTLASLSLVFALHHYKPTPLYVMDEIDAALDFRNVSIVGTYIKERTRNAQFVIISLRNNMFELADRLVGIYKTHNATKSVAINPAACVVPVR